MAWGYIFFSPVRLPIAPADLSEETVHSFTDAAEVRAALDAHLPGLVWEPDPGVWLAHGTVTEDDVRYELSMLPHDAPATAEAPATKAGARTLIVKLRCSGRVDSVPFAQRLCDATGWIAFDDRAYLFQPHQPPVPAGGG